MTPERFRLSAGRSAARTEAAPRWREVLELGARLPGGLVHAERVTVVPTAPDYLSPLTVGSRWHALGHGLVVVAQPEDVAPLLRDLGAYRALAGRIRSTFEGWPDAATALEAPSLAPDVALELGALLEASAASMALVEARAPNLRSDLAWMLRRGFDPEIVVHPALSVARQREAGGAVAELLLTRVPAGRFHLLVADSEAPRELLSPYAADLGHSLYAWGLEDPGRLPWAGLADALEGSAEAPERDLAAVVAQVLTDGAPEDVRAERLQNEASQGLWLEEAWGATFGVAELGLLEAPDPILSDRSEVLAVVLGGSDALRQEAVARLAVSGRLEGLGIVGRARQAGATPLVPEALVWDGDAIRLELGSGLARGAQKAGLPVRRVGVVEAFEDRGAPLWVARVLQAWRRARITGALDAQAKPVLGLAPGAHTRDLLSAQVLVTTAKIVTSGLLDPELVNRSGAGKARSGGRDGGISRRFRA